MPDFLDAFEDLMTGLGAAQLKDGLTIEELAIKTGRDVGWVREKLRLLAAAGRLIVGRKKQMGLDGRSVMAPAYKIGSAKARGKGG